MDSEATKRIAEITHLCVGNHYADSQAHKDIVYLLSLIDSLTRQVEAAKAEEREACAVMADKCADDIEFVGKGLVSEAVSFGKAKSLRYFAAAIRARAGQGEKK